MAQDEVPQGLPYGIIDPDYARVFTKARIAAWSYGYALGLQGSFTRDLDVIAVPWTEHACGADNLIIALEHATGLKRQGPPSDKPHGRKSVTLLFPEFGDNRWLDVAIFPLLHTAQQTQ